MGHKIDQPVNVVGSLDSEQQVINAAGIKGVVAGVIYCDDNKSSIRQCGRGIVMSPEPSRATV
jgi:hypothetical protein